MTLRDYQLRAVEHLRTLLRRGHRRLLLVGPCGSGKGSMVAALTGQWDASGAAVLVLAHRRELIDDLHARIVAEGVRAGVVMAGHPRADAGARVQVGSVQTVVNRSLPVPPRYIVFDEAHRSVAPSYLRIAERYPGAVVLGASVAPDSFVELRGGPFGAGFVGSIEAAWKKITDAELFEIGDYEIRRTRGVLCRGYEPKQGFQWKPVRHMIRHRGTMPFRRLWASGPLGLTDDHSVYSLVERSAGSGMKPPTAVMHCPPSGRLVPGNILAYDDGRAWSTAKNETGNDVLDVCKIMERHYQSPGKVKVCVDLTLVDRKAIGASPKEWYGYRRGTYGHYLPLPLFMRHRCMLPDPTWMYTEGAIGTGIKPFVNLWRWAYVLGFYLGDGYMSSPGRVTFATGLHETEAMLQRVAALDGVAWRPAVRPTPHKAEEIRCCNIFVATILRSLFGQQKAWEKAIPGSWIVSWPEHARRELLQGLMDSDGHLGNGGGGRSRYTLTTTSYQLAQGTASLVRSLGGHPSVQSPKKSRGGTVNGRQIEGRRQCYHVVFSSYDVWGSSYSLKCGARRRYRMNVAESKLWSTTPEASPPYVYDLEVAGHPSFVANGILVHNTASPWRADGRGLGSLYEEVVVAATTRELMDRGWLCEYTGIGFGEPDLSGVRVVAGDYDQRQLGRVMGGSAILGDIVQRWLDSAGGVRTVAFAVNREHSRRIAADFAAAGVSAEHLDGETPAEERRAILERWRSGSTRVLSNVEILTEGYDLPAIGCVILARPTLSTRLAVQMVGRGLRPAAGKERLRIHDHAGVLWRHGLPDADRDYSLTADTRKRRTDPPAALATCGACGALYGPGADSCPGCGAVRQVRRREIETLEGAKSVSLDDVRGVSEDAPDEQRDVFLALWRKAAGKPPGWASEQFRRKTGKFPRWRWLREVRRTM